MIRSAIQKFHSGRSKVKVMLALQVPGQPSSYLLSFATGCVLLSIYSIGTGKKGYIERGDRHTLSIIKMVWMGMLGTFYHTANF